MGMLNRASSRASRRGFSLTELAIVLAGVGLVLSVVWVASTRVWHNYQLQKTTEQMVTVAQNIRDYYGPIGRLPPLTANPIPKNQDIVPDVDAKNLVPVEMRDVAGGFRHALGGALVLLSNPAATAVSPTGLGQGIFRIVLQGLPDEDCIKMLMQIPVLMPEVGAVRLSTTDTNHVKIDTKSIDKPGTDDSGAVIDLPLSMDKATTWCAAGNGNEVRLDVKLRN